MKTLLAIPLLFLAVALPALAQPGPYRGYVPPYGGRPGGWQPGGWGATPDLNGTWFMNGRRDQPCSISQARPGMRAVFTNENGSQAWGSVRGDHVWIPAWSDGDQPGLEGIIEGNRIVWPNGSFWCR